jgi:diguanylate cyclase (GGDEF)-like protein
VFNGEKGLELARGKLVAGMSGLARRMASAPGVVRLSPASNLRVRLGLVLSSAALTVALVIAALVSTTGERWIASGIGQSVRQIAFQVADTLDRGAIARIRAIDLMAGLPHMRDPATPVAERRELLNGLRESAPDYAWIGIVRRDGYVVVATDGALESENVADRPWFAAGLQGHFVGDVPADPLLAGHAQSETIGDLPHVIAVAAPLTDGSERVWGVLGALLAYTWDQNIDASVMGMTGEDLHAEVFVVDGDGNVLLAPPGVAVAGNLAVLESATAAQAGRRGFHVEQWPNGATYLTGYAATQTTPGGPELGWTVLVRQNAEAAFQPVRQLQQQILTVGLAAALLLAVMGWYLAGRIAGPMVAITAAARRIERGERGVSFPRIKGSDELAVLARALDSLVQSLVTREQQLQRLTEMHEQRVRERTAELEEANVRLEALSTTDALTSVANRGQFDQTLDREWRQLARTGEPLSLIMIDIDHFKAYNDTYGHQQGDECLRQVAAALFHTATRAGDLVARYGGEEFGVILSHVTAAEAMLVAEKLRRAVFELRIPHKANPAAPGISISLGVATMIPQRDSDRADLVKMADWALYRAKADGRDRAVQSTYVPPRPSASDPAATHVDAAPNLFQFRRRRRP